MDGRKSTLRAVVRSYVQGVGFRVFVCSAAWQCGVKGYVKNMPDGTVQIIAAGEKSSVERLLDEVWRGPAGAHVTSVDTDWQDGEVEGLAPQFEVKH